MGCKNVEDDSGGPDGRGKSSSGKRAAEVKSDAAAVMPIKPSLKAKLGPALSSGGFRGLAASAGQK